MIVAVNETWRLDAACRGRTEVFLPVPNRKGGFTARQLAEAKAICATCPVQAQCEAWERANPQLVGIYPHRHRDVATRPRKRIYRSHKCPRCRRRTWRGGPGALCWECRLLGEREGVA